jgi:hypothetical protein
VHGKINSQFTINLESLWCSQKFFKVNYFIFDLFYYKLCFKFIFFLTFVIFI